MLATRCVRRLGLLLLGLLVLWRLLVLLELFLRLVRRLAGLALRGEVWLRLVLVPLQDGRNLLFLAWFDSGLVGRQDLHFLRPLD